MSTAYENDFVHHCSVGNVVLVELLLPNVSEDVKEYGIMCAAISNQPKVVEFLINKNVDISVRDNGWTLMHFAARDGNNEIIELLIAKGVDINIHDDAGHSVLFQAIWFEQLKSVKLLIEFGINFWLFKEDPYGLSKDPEFRYLNKTASFLALIEFKWCIIKQNLRFCRLLSCKNFLLKNLILFKLIIGEILKSDGIGLNTQEIERFISFGLNRKTLSATNQHLLKLMIAPRMRIIDEKT